MIIRLLINKQGKILFFGHTNILYFVVYLILSLIVIGFSGFGFCVPETGEFSQDEDESHHVLEETNLKCNRNRKIRRRCIVCYKKISSEHGCSVAVYKTKKVSTFCATCPKKPFVCLNCFPIHVRFFNKIM